MGIVTFTQKLWSMVEGLGRNMLRREPMVGQGGRGRIPGGGNVLEAGTGSAEAGRQNEGGLRKQLKMSLGQ